VRLNRYIANSGVCSRREADELITQGLISVNGKVITELGHKVMPGDLVKYDGKTLKREKLVYILLNKPKDFITTMDDPQDRKTVMELIAGACDERVFPVGRLDRNTTGLLLLTNDGELADMLTHPSSQISKIYEVELDKPLEKSDYDTIVNGHVHLFDGAVKVDEIAYLPKGKKHLGLEIHEGRNRIVRRIFEHLGYEVVRLDRTTYAGLTKRDLPRGNWRMLTKQEIAELKNLR
jgi:23S rRNA pseudouridine2605 synthase